MNTSNHGYDLDSSYVPLPPSGFCRSHHRKDVINNSNECEVSRVLEKPNAIDVTVTVKNHFHLILAEILLSRWTPNWCIYIVGLCRRWRLHEFLFSSQWWRHPQHCKLSYYIVVPLIFCWCIFTFYYFFYLQVFVIGR